MSLFIIVGLITNKKINKSSPKKEKSNKILYFAQLNQIKVNETIECIFANAKV